jgi:hypothetical protein
MEGIIHCLENNFEDFLTYSETKEDDKRNLTAFVGTRWGGSFWHHDLEDPSVQAEFSRRVQRFLGLGEVSQLKPRVFVRIINDSRELDLALRLKDALRRVFFATPIYLLLIVDIQQTEGPMLVEGADGLLVYFLSADTVFTGRQATDDRQTRAKGYASAVAFAVDYWCGGADTHCVSQVYPTLDELCAACDQFNGGSPSNELYSPKPFKGHRLTTNSRTPPALPKLFKGRVVEFTLPENALPGGMVRVELFGEMVTLRLPKNASAGSVMKCTLVEGVLSVVMVMAASTAAMGFQAACAAQHMPALGR